MELKRTEMEKNVFAVMSICHIFAVIRIVLPDYGE